MTYSFFGYFTGISDLYFEKVRKSAPSKVPSVEPTGYAPVPGGLREAVREAVPAAGSPAPGYGAEVLDAGAFPYGFE